MAVALAVGVRLWNALGGPLMWGYDAWGHVAYVFFVDVYRAIPWADQGWSYFHPPLHYLLAWPLTLFDNGDALMRGLALLGSAASLATAALAAWVVRVAAPSRPGLSLLGFCAVAFLPVHLYVSPMPGHEMTACFFMSAAIAAIVANERRDRPTLRGDAFTGAWIGLSLLVKFTGLLPLGIAGAVIGLRPLFAGNLRDELGRVALRGLVVTGVALAVAAPYYARNFSNYGGPFQKSADFPLVKTVEDDQPPGERSWRDYVTVSPRLFADPNPLAPHLIHSVWGTLYVSVWADVFREADSERALDVERGAHPSWSLIALLGLLPTALAFLGAALAARDVAAGRRRGVYVPMLATFVLSLVAIALYSFDVPRWPAVKAAYVFTLSLPFAAFLARSVEAVLERGARAGAALIGALAAIAATAAAVNTIGLVLPRRADSPATGAVRYHFGEYDAARALYTRLIATTGYPVAWLDNLAAVELADGHPDRARRLYARAVTLEHAAGRDKPYRRGQLAVALAVDGERAEAIALLDALLATQALPELFANRGALRAAIGDLEGAQTDLRSALSTDASLVPAWLHLARVQGALSHEGDAREARASAARAACRAPRGFPHGVGSGELLEWGVGRRALLLWNDDTLRVALPDFYRNACRTL
jgi:tetratricopeptide (TPR) repeat protein